MFKITKIEYTNKTLRLPTDLVEQLEAIAYKQEISLNKLVIQCCVYALENLDPADAVKPKLNSES